MTSQYQADDLDRVFSDVAESKRTSLRPLVIRACLLLVALIAVASVVVYWAVNQRQRQVFQELSQRSEILASTRVEVIRTWLDSLGAAGLHLSRSGVFRVFAAESGVDGSGPGQPASLATQIPYMRQVIDEFAGQEGLIGVYLVDSKGLAILSTSGAPELSPEERQSARDVFTQKERFVTGVRQYPDGLSLDVLLPVAQPQEENPDAPSNIAGVFIFKMPVHKALSGLLRPSPLAQQGETTRLFQVSGTGTWEMVPEGRPVLKKMSSGTITPGQALPFGRRAAIGEGTPVFSVGAWLPGMPWIVVQEMDAKTALAPLRSYSWGVAGGAILLILLLVSGFVAFWWRQSSEHNLALAEQYRELGAKIAAQRRFLNSLMNTLSEMIGLKKMGGEYAYVNPSFAEAVQRSPEDIEGADDAAIFGRGTAERLQQSDERALTSEKPVTVEEVVYLQDGPHHLQMSKVPYRDETGEVSGILIVSRDVTEIREAEHRRQRGFQAMTRTFIRTIEQVDPYLGGHSQNVRDLGVNIAKRLDLSPDEVTTIDIAAMLSQIGKLSIPAEIVSKKGRLSDAELKVMQGHVSHAVDLLRDVDFGLPVIGVIEQMYERLDGSGYPNGSSGNQICQLARILAVADVFAARIEPRSYREAISGDEAFGVLKSNHERYDESVVDALGSFLHTVEGEKLVGKIQAG